jgi:DNA excision repair protein ERCC-3
LKFIPSDVDARHQGEDLPAFLLNRTVMPGDASHFGLCKRSWNCQKTSPFHFGTVDNRIVMYFDDDDDDDSDTLDTTPAINTNNNEGSKDLKADHAIRPLFVCSDGKIIMEAFSPIADQAADFLTAIAEPISRPLLMHEYRLTEHSLYAAVSVGLDTFSIVKVLNRLSKTSVPKEVEEFIKEHTERFGKVKLVLKNNRYFLESSDADILRTLLQDEVIMTARKYGEDQPYSNNQDGANIDPSGVDGFVGGAGGVGGFLVEQVSTKPQKPLFQGTRNAAVPVTVDLEPLLNPQINIQDSNISLDDLDLDDFFADDFAKEMEEEASQQKNKMQIDDIDDDSEMNIDVDNAGVPVKEAIQSVEKDKETATRYKLDDSNDMDPLLLDQDINILDFISQQRQDDEPLLLSSFEIGPEHVEAVRRRCSELKFPVLEEYDFYSDRTIPDVRIDLKPSTALRPYQERSLNKMFGNGRARSGIVVLPCGAGKTLVGVTAACTIKKTCVVLCTSSYV